MDSTLRAHSSDYLPEFCSAEQKMSPKCRLHVCFFLNLCHHICKMEFGERLKELRTSLNYSQKELSEKTGLTLRTIQRIENNEVKPSLYSLKMIGEALNTDVSEFAKQSVTKPYEVNLSLKITDMNQFLNDLKVLVKTHWKTIFFIVLVIYLFTSYTDIKAGIMDAWSGK